MPTEQTTNRLTERTNDTGATLPNKYNRMPTRAHACVRSHTYTHTNEQLQGYYDSKHIDANVQDK